MLGVLGELGLYLYLEMLAKITQKLTLVMPE